MGAHVMLAQLTRNPIWQIQEKEGEDLANALADVMEQYDIVVSAKAQAWVSLFAASLAVYGPRVYVMAQTKAQQSKAVREATVSRAMEAGDMQYAGMPVVN